MPLLDKRVESLGLDQRLIRDVSEMVPYIYALIAGDEGYEPEAVHVHPICIKASNLIMHGLWGLGYDAGADSAVVEFPEEIQREKGYRGYNHTYPYVQDEEREVIVESNWQLWLPEELRHEDTPKILLGTRPDIVRLAEDYGINDTYALKLWLPHTERIS